MTPLTPTDLAEINLNAWPAIQTYLYQGMVVRWADGFTKRANSATLLYDAGYEERKLKWVEGFFQERGLPAIFRLLSFNTPEQFNAALVARDYEEVEPSIVQLADLTQKEYQQHTGIRLFHPTREMDEFLQIYHQLEGKDLALMPAHRSILDRVPGKLIPVILYDSDVPVACGLGVYTPSERVVGLFDIVTDRTKRQRGYGSQLVGSLLSISKQLGATQASLQVVAANTPARKLYDKFKFTPLYRYWYMRSPR